MAEVPTFTMRQLLEAGVHFGHQTHRWNPKMDPYLFGVRSGVHIIDLQQSVPMIYRALEFVQGVVSQGGRVLFVGTKRQAQEPVASAAKRCGQYFVNHRWLGGMLTNWRTVSNSISRLRTLDQQLDEQGSGLTKKELLKLNRERDRLERTLGGIREMGGLPDALFIIDTNKEEIAKHEAAKLGIPVIAVVDSNSDPEGINYPIPGNDDATRAINLYCDLVAKAVLGGLQAELVARDSDVGASEKGMVEELPVETEASTSEAESETKTKTEQPAEAEAPAAVAVDDAKASTSEAESETKTKTKTEQPAEAEAQAAVAVGDAEASTSEAESETKTEQPTEAEAPAAVAVGDAKASTSEAESETNTETEQFSEAEASAEEVVGETVTDKGA